MVEAAELIRTRTIRARLGIVAAGAGGYAATYTFDSDGLSSDSRLAPALQSLTPAQLQNALDGGDPAADLLSLLRQDVTGTGAGSLPCGTADNPTCGPPPAPIPTWVWYAGAAVGGIVLLGAIRK
jgi:hypothetical protein